jgi:hypothetical protein
MAASINVSSDRGVKRKFDSIDIEDLLFTPSNSELSKKQQHDRLILLYNKVMNITETKMGRISNIELCLHRCVLMDQTHQKLYAVYCEKKNYLYLKNKNV